MFRTLLIAGLVAAFQADAATAILNAISETASPRTLIVEFRAASVVGWKVRSASLVLHVASGALPKQVHVAPVPAPGKAGKFRAFPAVALAERWVRVSIDPVLVEQLAAGKGFGLAFQQGRSRFDGLAPVFTQPHLMVEGVPSR